MYNDFSIMSDQELASQNHDERSEVTAYSVDTGEDEHVPDVVTELVEEYAAFRNAQNRERKPDPNSILENNETFNSDASAASELSSPTLQTSDIIDAFVAKLECIKGDDETAGLCNEDDTKPLKKKRKRRLNTSTPLKIKKEKMNKPKIVKEQDPSKFHQCLGSVKNVPQLQCLLPAGFKYVVCSFSSLEPFQGQEDRFEVMFRVSADTQAKALRWLEKFQLSSKTTWRVDKTYPEATKLIFKKEFHCQHNTRWTCHRSRIVKGSHKKNTNCPSKLTLTVKKFAPNTKSRDPHAQKFAMVVSLKQAHNHLVLDADALRYRPVAPDIRAKFIRMFNDGLTPPKALAEHRLDLKRAHEGDDTGYNLAIADRSCCPDVQWCYRLYYKLKGKYEGPVTTERIDGTEKALRGCISDLCMRLERNPHNLVPGIERFLDSIQLIKSDADLAAAFTAFRVPIPVQPQSQDDLQRGTQLSEGNEEELNTSGNANKRRRGRPKKDGELGACGLQTINAITTMSSGTKHDYHLQESQFVTASSNQHQLLGVSHGMTVGGGGAQRFMYQTAITPSVIAAQSHQLIPSTSFINSTPSSASRYFADIPAESWNVVLSSYAGGGGHFVTTNEMQYAQLCEDMTSVQQSLHITGDNGGGGTGQQINVIHIVNGDGQFPSF